MQPIQGHYPHVESEKSAFKEDLKDFFIMAGKVTAIALGAIAVVGAVVGAVYLLAIHTGPIGVISVLTLTSWTNPITALFLTCLSFNYATTATSALAAGTFEFLGMTNMLLGIFSINLFFR